jgi:hypothetical protein
MANSKSMYMLAVGIGAIAVCAAVIAGGVGGALARTLADNPPPDKPAVQAITDSSRSPAQPAGAAVALNPVLQYQGRLSNPSTGDPINGVQQMSFRLYDVANGGSALWTETKNVQVSGGLFSTALGDTTPLSQNLFNGQALWLGVTVGADLEAVPRQPLMAVAYALSLLPGATISTSGSSPVLRGYSAGNTAYFSSTVTHGVRGETASQSPGQAGVLGQAGADPGALPNQESGVMGRAANGNGVSGISTSQSGVYGLSTSGSAGVRGESLGPAHAVYGLNAGTGYGGYFYSYGNYGAYFYGANGRALYAAGSVTVTNDLHVYGKILPAIPRTLSFPAGEISIDLNNGVITPTAKGLLWRKSYTRAAYLSIARPDDWDGVSNVSFTIYFQPMNSSSGNVSFFIRPRAYNIGDQFVDAPSLDATSVPVGGLTYAVKAQTFMISAATFGTKSLWVISIQNEGTGSTYTGEVTLNAVTLAYSAYR